jgi:hypothetical protein
MSVCVNAGLLAEILILTRLGICGFFLDFGGREHIIILSSLMELSHERMTICEGQNYCLSSYF